ncbi:hypothetical protein PHET_01330 [Paragonimus heterotremus]|uniref:Uncharacterized protein n=1 Tax=Paragonimus heterotremus TaxID=100268 RepID=A0A8J4WKH8_9TREM|nr:hypothetical protein PHET_01330 [Paragonimus heterotremus]
MLKAHDQLDPIIRDFGMDKFRDMIAGFVGKDGPGEEFLPKLEEYFVRRALPFQDRQLDFNRSSHEATTASFVLHTARQESQAQTLGGDNQDASHFRNS